MWSFSNGCTIGAHSVIWEWQDDYGKWIPYRSEVSNGLENLYSKGYTFVSLSSFDSNLSNYIVNFNDWTQERYNVSSRKVRREFYLTETLPTDGNFWEWQDTKLIWQPYTILLQIGIEMAYKKGAKNLNLSDIEKKNPYAVDFATMTQTRRRTGKKRKIQRIEKGPYQETEKEHTELESTSDLETPLNNPKKVLKKSVKEKKKSVAKPKTSNELSENDSQIATSEEDFSIDEILKKYTALTTSFDNNDSCCICCNLLSLPSEYDETSSNVIQFKTCGHVVHQACIKEMQKSNMQVEYVQCPICKTIYGHKHGNQPNGTMSHYVFPRSLPGYNDCETIVIVYKIPHGTQGQEHPNPGQRFSARGFPRHCYLPNNQQGKKILKLLEIAWKRRLIFTISTSATTGEENTVTWNEIHHKTEFGSNYSGHGYPDPQYLDNVLMELAAQGVVDE